MGNAKYQSGEPVCQHGTLARCCNVCELEAEVERLREQCAGWDEAFRKAMEDWHDIAVLREREIDELRRDASRYRWLQEKIKQNYGMWFIDARLGREGPTEIGAAIDYAMRNGA